jgi:hypothetical protein
MAVRCVRRVLAVGVETVVAELDLNKDATGGVELGVSSIRLYHLALPSRTGLVGLSIRNQDALSKNMPLP